MITIKKIRWTLRRRVLQTIYSQLELLYGVDLLKKDEIVEIMAEIDKKVKIASKYRVKGSKSGNYMKNNGYYTKK